MSTSDITPPPKWLKSVNKVMVFVSSKFGAKMGPVHVLTVPGRASGAPRSTPISVLARDGKRYAVAGFPESDWVRNARAAQTGTLASGKRVERVRVVAVSSDEARPVLRDFPAKVPTGVGFMKRQGWVKEGTAEEFEALAGKAVVFRFDPL